MELFRLLDALDQYDETWAQKILGGQIGDFDRGLLMGFPC